MGDMGDVFRAMKEQVKERKTARLKNNTEKLKDIDIPYTRDFNGTIHFQTKWDYSLSNKERKSFVLPINK